MANWEYLVLSLAQEYWIDSTGASGKLSAKDAEEYVVRLGELLTSYGRTGWELVAFNYDPRTYTFKRPL